jgi:hypothetical protein
MQFKITQVKWISTTALGNLEFGLGQPEPTWNSYLDERQLVPTGRDVREAETAIIIGDRVHIPAVEFTASPAFVRSPVCGPPCVQRFLIA